jgi:hypothetical protein
VGGEKVKVLVYWGILVFATTVLAQQPDSVGRVVALTGQVMVQHPGSTPEPLTMQSPLYRYDLIHTQAAAKVRIALVDGTILSLGEQSTLRISDFVYTPGQESRKALLTVIGGVFRLVVTTVLPRSSFEVHTTNTVAAIRGTDWLGQVERNTTALVVLQGEVAVAHIRPEVQGSVQLTAGMGTDVVGEQPPTPPKQWGEARLQGLITATTLP